MSCKCNRCNQGFSTEFAEMETFLGETFESRSSNRNGCRRAIEGIQRDACAISNEVEKLEALVNNLKTRAAQAEERCLDNDDDDDDDDNGHCGCRRCGCRRCGSTRNNGCGSTRSNGCRRSCGCSW